LNKPLGYQIESQFPQLSSQQTVEPAFVLLTIPYRENSTGTYIFLLDTAFSIFHCSPPRLMIPEMRVSLVCPEDCFQAASAEECFVLLLAWTRSQPLQAEMSLFEAVGALCGTGGVGLNHTEDLTGLSILNMFTIISGTSKENPSLHAWPIRGKQDIDYPGRGKAIHSLAFHFQTSLASHTELSHIQRGLDDWMRLWTRTDRRQEVVSQLSGRLEDVWKRIGFYQHANEYWLLAQIELENLKYPGVSRYGTLYSRAGVGSGQAASPTYDDGEMRNVKGLLMAFQNLHCV
jgi:hypothetical protein